MKANEYIQKRKVKDSKFAKGYDKGLEDFVLSQTLRDARIKAGLTQEQLAKQIGTKRSAISRLEKHAKDIKVSTLEKVAKALGKSISIQLV